MEEMHVQGQEADEREQLEGQQEMQYESQQEEQQEMQNEQQQEEYQVQQSDVTEDNVVEDSENSEEGQNEEQQPESQDEQQEQQLEQQEQETEAQAEQEEEQQPEQEMEQPVEAVQEEAVLVEVIPAEETTEGEIGMEEQPMEQPQQTGKTTIADSVVAKIAEIATREIQGVHELGGAAERVVSGAISKITGGAGRAAGVSVVIGDEEAAIDVNMIAEYGLSIPEVTNNVRQNVMNQVQAFTGLRVKEVNIYVNDLYFPGEETQSQEERGESASQ